MDGVDGALHVFALVMTFVVAPCALVWPRAWAHLGVPRPARPYVARHRADVAWLAAGLLGSLTAAGMSDWILRSLVSPAGLPHPWVAIASLWAIFGGLAFLAVRRSLLLGGREWAVRYGIPLTSRRGASAPWPAPPKLDFSHDLPMAIRPEKYRTSRWLRGAGRWLAAAGMGWYLFGRGIGLAHIADGSSDVPGWWWDGALVLSAVGAGVWAARRMSRRRLMGGSQRVDIADVLQHWGFALVRPADEAIMALAPQAFLPPSSRSSTVLLPWLATKEIEGRRVALTQEILQQPTPSGLSGTVTRTVCIVEVPGAEIPVAVVCARESVPPLLRARSIDLELHTFNRSLWAWGPDPRGFHDVLHPLVLGPILEGLPDGASLVFGQRAIAVYNDEPVLADDLAAYVSLVHRLAENLPRYLAPTG